MYERTHGVKWRLAKSEGKWLSLLGLADEIVYKSSENNKVAQIFLRKMSAIMASQKMLGL